MSLQTGGRAMGATSTRSSSESWASRNASPIDTTPTCSPSGPTRRTSGTRIRSLMRGSVMASPLLLPVRSRARPGRRRERRPREHQLTGPVSPVRTRTSVRAATTDRRPALAIRGPERLDGVRWERAPLGSAARGGAAGWFACLDEAGRHAHSTARSASQVIPGVGTAAAAASAPGPARRPAAPGAPRRRRPPAPCPRPGWRTARPRRRCAAPATPRATSGRTRRRAPPSRAARAAGRRSGSGCRRPRPRRSSAPGRAGRRRRPGRVPATATWSTVPKATTPVDDDFSVSGHEEHDDDDDRGGQRARLAHPPGTARTGAGPGEDGSVTPPWCSIGRLAECEGVEITGTAQHEAWQARALPPVEQLRDDLWSIPVPIPHNPLRYVSVYAFALDGGGLGLLDTGWESDEGWTALTGGLASIGGGVDDVRGVLVTHLHFDHLGLAARVREASGAWVAMHPADATAVARLSTRRGRDDGGRRGRVPRRAGRRPRRGRRRRRAARADGGVHPHGRARPAAGGRRARRLPRLADARRPHPGAHAGPPLLRRGEHRAVLLRRPRPPPDQSQHLHDPGPARRIRCATSSTPWPPCASWTRPRSCRPTNGGSAASTTASTPSPRTTSSG